MEPLMLDGNAIGGLLQDVFATEMTTAIGTCDNCGAAEPVGAIHVFRGAGVLLRCPHCDNALMTIVRGDGSRIWLGFPGVRALELVTQPSPARP
ncbi:MAG: hypothetical protein J2P40_01840 [Candidatus Dormibacteraeota bacterium]|nr:hypothetical protein [Candidatus Dormibacteraeota bacterium]MBO0703871.1 hypothetical protein [Candidatus Dormibacteraeota bacterium]MBO0759993.1 hypothetical protein [Candidatus Dormibacteraeota bacterium]